MVLAYLCAASGAHAETSFATAPAPLR